jgi:hypothetical protein
MHIMTAHDVEQLTSVSHSWRRRYVIEILRLLYFRARVGARAAARVGGGIWAAVSGVALLRG